MDRFELGDAEVVVMFRYGEHVVAARGPLRSFSVSRDPIEIPSPDLYRRYMAGTTTEIRLDMIGDQIVTVKDGVPNWDEAQSRLPQPRLTDGV